MSRKGKASTIRYNSNRNYDFYDNGRMDKSKLNKRDKKIYEKYHKEEEPRRYRKKVNGVWKVIESKPKA